MLPISPVKLYIAANRRDLIDGLRSVRPKDLAAWINRQVVGRARRFTYASDGTQEHFIRKQMSTDMEPTPLFPDFGKPFGAGGLVHPRQTRP